MTVVNAIRFNDHAGAMVCDEQVSYGDMTRKGDIGDKIRPLVPTPLQEEFGIVAAYGGSGTSSVSEEIKELAIALLDEALKKSGKMPRKKLLESITIPRIADEIFNRLCVMKRRHIDEYFFHRYGFTGADLIRGYYEGAKGRVDINQKDVIEEAHDAMIYKDAFRDLRHLYVNRGIMAGYDPIEGFRLFYFNMMTFSYEPVQAIFQSIGSGQDTSDLAFADFIATKTIQERRGLLDPVESMISIIHATNLASRNNVGVGGYYNIVIIDGSKEHSHRLREIADDRAKLASETVAAWKAELIERSRVEDAIEGLLFNDTPLADVEKVIFQTCVDPKRLSRFLRGYKAENRNHAAIVE